MALSAQDVASSVLRAGGAADTVTIDGLLREPAWAATDAADAFTQTDRPKVRRPRVALRSVC